MSTRLWSNVPVCASRPEATSCVSAESPGSTLVAGPTIGTQSITCWVKELMSILPCNSALVISACLRFAPLPRKLDTTEEQTRHHAYLVLYSYPPWVYGQLIFFYFWVLGLLFCLYCRDNNGAHQGVDGKMDHKDGDRVRISIYHW